MAFIHMVKLSGEVVQLLAQHDACLRSVRINEAYLRVVRLIITDSAHQMKQRRDASATSDCLDFFAHLLSPSRCLIASFEPVIFCWAK